MEEARGGSEDAVVDPGRSARAGSKPGNEEPISTSRAAGHDDRAPAGADSGRSRFRATRDETGAWRIIHCSAHRVALDEHVATSDAANCSSRVPAISRIV